MSVFNKIIETPVEPCAQPPKGNKGGPGTYDGMTGYPGRTPSPNAVPEKIIDGQKPLAQDKE
jgi:hypothetical protein